MAAIIQGTEVGIKATGTTVTVPDNPKAKLMYYLNCMCQVMNLSDNEEINRLGDYRNYYLLSEEDIDALLILCLLFEPRVLNDKCIFLNNDLAGGNEFFELSAVKTTVGVTEDLLIGGVQRKVQMIMMFKTEWMENNYLNPMKYFENRLKNLVKDDDDEEVESGPQAPPVKAITAAPETGTRPTAESYSRQPVYHDDYSRQRRPRSRKSDFESCCTIL